MPIHHTKDGKAFSIRQPKADDAEAIIAYAQLIFASTDQVLTTPEEYNMTVAQERSWINRPLQEASTLILIATLDSQIIGLLDFTAKPKKKIAHTGEFGVSVHPDHRRAGVGRALIQTLLAWANENTQIEKVILNVFASNRDAISLYKALGFVEECRQINAIKQPSGEYIDLIQMYIDTR